MGKIERYLEILQESKPLKQYRSKKEDLEDKLGDKIDIEMRKCPHSNFRKKYRGWNTKDIPIPDLIKGKQNGICNLKGEFAAYKKILNWISKSKNLCKKERDCLQYAKKLFEDYKSLMKEAQQDITKSQNELKQLKKGINPPPYGVIIYTG